MKNNLIWFSHDADARNHPKMKALKAEYGMAGYGMFWALNEIISESSESSLDISRRVNKLAVAGELGLTSEKFDQFIEFLADPEIDLINFENGIVTTDRTQENYSQTYGRRQKKREWYDEKKSQKQEKTNSDIQNENLPSENANLPSEMIHRTEQKRTEQKRTDTECVSPEDLFVRLWQQNPDIFNLTATLRRPQDWNRYWEKSTLRPEQIQIAVENFTQAIRDGTIERRYIPSSPDTFVLNGWLEKSQAKFLPRDGPKKHDTKKLAEVFE